MRKLFAQFHMAEKETAINKEAAQITYFNRIKFVQVKQSLSWQQGQHTNMKLISRSYTPMVRERITISDHSIKFFCDYDKLFEMTS